MLCILSAVIPKRHLQPYYAVWNYNSHLLNTASDLFHQPVGLLCRTAHDQYYRCPAELILHVHISQFIHLSCCSEHSVERQDRRNALLSVYSSRSH